MSDFHSSQTITARKQHRCTECGGIIEAGEQYDRHAGNYGGDFYTYKLCGLCGQAWRWFGREYDPDPDTHGVGDLATHLEEAWDYNKFDFTALRIAAYIRRNWRNRVTGERYEFPAELKVAS
jgi:hypothetical protein